MPKHDWKFRVACSACIAPRLNTLPLHFTAWAGKAHAPMRLPTTVSLPLQLLHHHC